jgi:nicotinamidase-related amidase
MMTTTIDSPETLPDWPIPWPAFEVDWNRAALVVIDYQNYSSNPDVGLARMFIEKYPAVAAYYIPRITEITIPNTRRLLDVFREAGREVIFTRHGALLPDGRDMILRRRRRDVDALTNNERPHLWSRGSFEHQVVDQLAPLPHELVIDKNASSPFNGSAIDQLLRNMGVDTLVVAGMATDMCVETTSRDAADRGYNVIVVEDGVATFVEEHHIAALSALARVFTQVWDTARVISTLKENLDAN